MTLLAGGTYKAVEEEDTPTPTGRRVPKMTRMPEMSVKVALSLRRDLQVTIPRAEVEEIHSVVMSELSSLQDGCVGAVVGGHAEFT